MIALPAHPAVRAGAVLGFVAAALVGWNLADDFATASTTAPPAAEKTTRPGVRPDRSSVRGNIPAEARAHVAALRAIRSPEERMRATIHFANTLPVSEFEGWLDGRWFDLGEGYDLTLFNKITQERWKAEDPEGLLRWYLKDSPGMAAPILAEMAERDPGRLLEFFQENPNPSLALQTFTQLAKTNPALALQGLQTIAGDGLSRNGNDSYYARQLLVELAKSAPGSLGAALESLPISLRNTAEAALLGQKLSASFSAGIRELWDRPDGWRIFQEAIGHDRKLGAGLLGELANLPPGWRTQIAGNSHYFIETGNAAEWFNTDFKGLGFSDNDSRRLQNQALSRLAASQPEEALRLLATSEFNADERRNVIGNLFGNLSGNPEKAEAMIASLATEDERQYARGHMGLSPQTTVSAQNVEKPEEWLEKAAAAEPGHGNYAFFSILSRWDPEKIHALSTQFRAMEAGEKSKVAQMLASESHGARIDPSLRGEAIKHLVANPPPPQPNTDPFASGNSRAASQTIRQASQHAVSWARTDPAAASTWVQSLPNGDEKAWAQKNLAVNWAEYDPQAAEQWVNSLPAASRTEVQDFMKNPGGR